MKRGEPRCCGRRARTGARGQRDTTTTTTSTTTTTNDSNNDNDDNNNTNNINNTNNASNYNTPRRWPCAKQCLFLGYRFGGSKPSPAHRRGTAKGERTEDYL